MADDQSLRAEAVAWALRMVAGIADRGEVIAWADGAILVSTIPPDWLVTVSLGSRLSEDRLVRMLCPTECRPVDGEALVQFFRALQEAWAGSKLTGPVIARTLYEMLQIGFLPARLDGVIYHLDDAYELEVGGFVPGRAAEKALADLLRQESAAAS
ncbi:MAG: hypothetical protein ACM3XM_03355 [Mycobacterium leprae]